MGESKKCEERKDSFQASTYYFMLISLIGWKHLFIVQIVLGNHKETKIRLI